MKKTILALLTGLFVAAGAQAAYPDKPVTIIVPFPPGGSTDMLARIMTPKMAEKLGQPVVVENKPGATGANPNVPAKDVKELIEYLKQKPNKVTFPSSGAGSSDHLTAALFWMSTGTTGIHVPYKGGGPAIADLVAGHAEVSFQNLNNVIGHIKAGKLKALAVTSEKRAALLPDVPTMVELGYKDMVVTSWQALAAPKGLPPEVKNAIHGAMMAALKDPETAKKLTDPGFEVTASSPEEFNRFLQSELAKWKTVIEVGKITLD
jgi:tripartite-type tricarboxylate transporter receptor subunit TctC